MAGGIRSRGRGEMITIKTSLKEFRGKGIGLVSEQFVKKGQIVWVFNSKIDICFNKKEIPEELSNFFDTYGVEYKEKIFLSIDNARFINHSKNPNTKSLGLFKENIAIRDIKRGEEITIDYETLEDKPVNFKVK